MADDFYFLSLNNFGAFIPNTKSPFSLIKKAIPRFNKGTRKRWAGNCKLVPPT
jgi:hypothetical protein